MGCSVKKIDVGRTLFYPPIEIGGFKMKDVFKGLF
jgi:hypothetical protein